MSSLGSRPATMSLGIPRSGIATRASAWPPARLSCFRAGRKIRISGRLWMNSLDALAAAAKEGAGIGRVPWQLEADLAAGHLARLRTDCEPAPAPLHPMFQPPRLTSPRIRAFVDELVERWRGIDPFGARSAPTNKQNQYSILRPCQMAVVYQAAEQSRFNSLLAMNGSSISSDLIVARTDSTP